MIILFFGLLNKKLCTWLW